MLENIVEIKRQDYQSLENKIQELNTIFGLQAMSDKLVKNLELNIKRLYFEYTGVNVELIPYIDYDKQTVKFDTNIKFTVCDSIEVKI